jgi:uncharacterized membrane protein
LAVDHALIAIVVWLLAIELIGLAVLPLAATVLSRTPDRGAFSARLLGLLLIGWLGWISAAIGLWQSRTANVSLALAAIAGVSWSFARWRERRGTPLTLPSRRAYGVSAAVWMGLFGFFLLLRAIYPDFW